MRRGTPWETTALRRQTHPIAILSPLMLGACAFACRIFIHALCLRYAGKVTAALPGAALCLELLCCHTKVASAIGRAARAKAALKLPSVLVAIELTFNRCA
jgi:hypothetical protein